MNAPVILITGFGPYDEAELNPSREVARLLESSPPPGVRVRGRELPVTFRGAPAAVRAEVASLEDQRPTALLGLGRHGEAWFSLERRARGRYDTERVDNDGESGAGLALEVGDDLVNELDLELLAGALRTAGAGDVRVSDDAGGYICEITNHALLGEGRRLGVPALFLHIPPVEILSPEQQAPFVGALAVALARSG